MAALKLKPVIEIPGLDIPKAKRYSRTRLTLFLGSTLLGLARAAWFADRGRSAGLRSTIAQRLPDKRLRTPAYLASAAVLGWIANLPLAYFAGHRVERHFGLTKQTTRGWLADELKGLGLGLALQVPLSSAAYAIIRRRPRDWWLILSAATVPLAVLASNLAPVVILPLFNRFDPLRDQDPALADRVLALADRAGVNVADVFRMDMSRQSEKPNAFFAGLGPSKRIVLGDTLLNQFTGAEVEGIVAHELGHQVHGDIWRLIALGGGLGFSTAFLASRLAPPLIAATADRTGVDDLGDEASLPLLTIVLTAIGFLAAPVQAAHNRAIERRTDRFALALTGDGPSYASAMARLAATSLADPDPPQAVVFFLYSHPPIAERIVSAREFRPDQQSG